ncbi:TRAP transporter substrate-binding protein [Roseomonas sp. KE2513]|uniref:TRAP transporter substrate-binding protein n=1 Tax=Roseomonas sp. KE2513 TaxID=2479202 RepID=UPI0018DFDF0D|nr:TRAP transporter substrate-binding protein [Roseomonas sp. KE2513]MBI0533965.1 TRAP transporter substrate-binding protein [Roseomonas sp. KE2513]
MTRITRRAFGRTGLGALAALSLARATHAQGTAMKMASATVNDVQHEWLRRYDAALRARLGDRVNAEIYPASQLGAIPRMVEGLLLGTIESFVTPTSFVVPVDPRMQVFDAPGLFRSPEHLQRVITDTETRARSLALLEGRGVKGIGIFYNSPVVVLSRKPIRSLADFRGQKIRTFASPLQTRPMEHFGATPVPMALSEVMPALQSGAIDGLLAGIPVLSALRYYDVAKTVTEIHPAIVVSVFLVNKRWYDRLPADVRTAMAEEGARVDRDIFAWTTGAIDEANKAWAAGGGEIVRLPPEEQERMMRELSILGEGILGTSAPVKAEYEALRRVAERLA